MRSRARGLSREEILRGPHGKSDQQADGRNLSAFKVDSREGPQYISGHLPSDKSGPIGYGNTRMSTREEPPSAPDDWPNTLVKGGSRGL